MNVQILYRFVWFWSVNLHWLAVSLYPSQKRIVIIIQESLSTLFSLYIRDAGLTEDNVDAGWLGRQGVALALHSSADVLRTKDLPVVMTFLISRALVKFTSLFFPKHELCIKLERDILFFSFILVRKGVVVDFNHFVNAAQYAGRS